MKKHSINLSVFLIIILLGLLSCKKDKPIDLADADVYVNSVLSDGEPVFGLSHRVVGYAAMTAVTVESPGGTTDQLSAYDAGKTIFYSDPVLQLGTYSSTPPEPGTYSYSVTFQDGTEKVFTNELSALYLLPPTIISINKSTSGQSVIISWEPVTGAQYFQVSIYKDGSFVSYGPGFAPPNGNSFEVSLSYIPSYTPGTYTFQLGAMLYESDGSGKVQAVSSASQSIDLN